MMEGEAAATVGGSDAESPQLEDKTLDSPDDTADEGSDEAFQCFICLGRKKIGYFSPQLFDDVITKMVHDGLAENALENGYTEQVSITDVLCAACNPMLFRPAVLNCGHIYCEDCMYSLANGTLRCQVCKSCHPGGFPKVCLDLDHFLEKHFPEEYAQRKDADQCWQQHAGPSTCDSQNEEDNIRSERVDASLKMNSVTSAYTVHIQVGCDSCGAYPIIGKRHNCKDCVEKIGFDLCGDCYENRSTLPGRFNQQHTPEHIFKLIDSTDVLGVTLFSEDEVDQEDLNDSVSSPEC